MKDSNINRRSSTGAFCEWCEGYIQQGEICIEHDVLDSVDGCALSYCGKCIGIAYGELTLDHQKTKKRDVKEIKRDE